jgi:SAM-dependent methyltransferase
LTIEALRSQLDALDQADLYEQANFRGRAEVIDTIEFAIIDRIDGLLADPSQPHELRRGFASSFDPLRRAAERLQRRLEAVDEGLFQSLRSANRHGCRGEALREMIGRYAEIPAADDQGQAVVGYDSLDRLVNGMLGSDALPEARLEPEPEMVLYQKTPARIIFELVHRAQLGPQDRFYDLGSGMGHVTTLVHLLSGARARGVEFEPAFCEYARACAAALRLTQVEFINEDARRADYGEGSFFFMYTPFEGAMLLEVLGRLRERSRSGPIRLATYGPCTAVVAQQDWLSAPSPAEPGSYRLALFSSRGR